MYKFFRSYGIYIFAGILVLCLFLLRFVHLTILPVFADEAIYIRWAQVMKAEETLRFLPLSDGKEPLYMWALIPFLKIIHDPLFAGRALSVFSGFGTLIGVTYLSWLLFRSKPVALAAAAIYTVSPFTFFFDRMALVDSMLSMFGIWTFIFSYLAVTRKRLDFAMIAGFTLGGAWLTKSPALFFAILLPTLWLFVPWKKELIKNTGLFLKTVSLSLVTIVIGYCFYNILRLGPNFEMIARRNLDYVYPLVHFVASPLDPLKPYFIQSLQWLVILGPVFILILLAYGIVFNAYKFPKNLLVLGVWFLFPIIIQSEFAKVLTARYILFSIPYLIIMAASVFTETRAAWLKVLLLIFGFFLAQSLLSDYFLFKSPEKANLPRNERSGYLEEWSAGQGIKQVADYITNEQFKHPDEKIVVGTEGYFGTLPDGLQMYLNNMRQITVIGVGLNFSDVPKPLIESRNFGNKTYLVINDDRFKGDPKKEGLTLIATYPKALRPDGTHESLLFFELNTIKKP